MSLRTFILTALLIPYGNVYCASTRTANCINIEYEVSYTDYLSDSTYFGYSYATSVNDCCQICSITSGCALWSYDSSSNICYGMSQKNPLWRVNDEYSVDFVSGQPVKVYYDSPDPKICNNVENGVSYQYYLGDDQSFAYSYESSVAGCCATCSKTNGCILWSYDTIIKYCYFLSQKNPQWRTKDTDTALYVSGQPLKVYYDSPDPKICNNVENGVSYQYYLGDDQSFAYSYESSVAGCCATCSKTNGCILWSYDTIIKYCYFLSQKNPQWRTKDTDTALYVSGQPLKGWKEKPMFLFFHYEGWSVKKKQNVFKDKVG